MSTTSNTRVLAGAGAVLIASHAALVWIVAGLSNEPGAKTFAPIAPMVLALALPAGLALLAAPRLATIAPSRIALALVFVTGLALRALWFGSPALIEDDFNRYLWDGAVVAHGLDPYRHAPSDILAAAPAGYEAIADAGRAILERVNFPELTSLYPSLAQLSFALAHLMAPFNLDALRVVFLAAEVATFLLLCALLVARGASPLWSALYWCNPLPAFTLIGMAHVDALIPPCVLGAALMLQRARPAAAVAMLSAGAGVKIWPLLLVPLALAPLLREPRRLMLPAGVLAVGLAAAIGPLLIASYVRPDSGLGAYAAGWDVNNAFFAWGERALAWILGDEEPAQAILRALLALAAGAIALLVAYRRYRGSLDFACGALIVAASIFYLSPAQFPWYAAWFLPLAALVRSWPLLLASATLPLCYLVDPFWLAGLGDAYGFYVAFLHALPVLGWLAWDAIQGRRMLRDQATKRHCPN
jgi:alpha-1,6-mannosyltransferase